MFKPLAVLSILTTVALAQSASNSAPAAAGTAASAIPAGVSSGCSSFLTTFNQDSNFATCLQPLLNASKGYLPDGSATHPTAASIASALDKLCSPDTAASACSSDIIRAKLADFQSGCSAELMNSPPNQDVVKIYDALYLLSPLKKAICSQDTAGKYCVTEPAASSSAASNNTRRGTSSTTSFTPDAAKWTSENVAYLLLNANLPSSALCTTCTREIIGSYIAFESDVPYSPGLEQSAFMSGQPKLYEAITNTCGANFLSGAVQAAGGISGGIMGAATNGARSLSGEYKGSLALIVSLAGLVVML